jgi:alpha-tubulin suppressor-like RCC1 family protein
LGDGTIVDRHRPVAVRALAGAGPLTNVASLGAADNHTCAALSNGEARCWGDGTSGQLGNGVFNERHRPVRVKNGAGSASLTGVASISSAIDHACARLTNGQVRCWGSGSEGRLGDATPGPHALPVIVRTVSGPGALSGVTGLTTGDTHTCVVLGSGGVRCWGLNDSGQDGDGSSGGHRPRPVVVVR